MLDHEVDPTPSDLVRIEAEESVIAAEIEIVGAECQLAEDPANRFAARRFRRAVLARNEAVAAYRSRSRCSCSVA